MFDCMYYLTYGVQNRILSKILLHLCFIYSISILLYNIVFAGSSSFHGLIK